MKKLIQIRMTGVISNVNNWMLERINEEGIRTEERTDERENEYANERIHESDEWMNRYKRVNMNEAVYLCREPRHWQKFCLNEQIFHPASFRDVYISACSSMRREWFYSFLNN